MSVSVSVSVCVCVCVYLFFSLFIYFLVLNYLFVSLLAGLLAYIQTNSLFACLFIVAATAAAGSVQLPPWPRHPPLVLQQWFANAAGVLQAARVTAIVIVIVIAVVLAEMAAAAVVMTEMIDINPRPLLPPPPLFNLASHLGLGPRTEAHSRTSPTRAWHRPAPLASLQWLPEAHTRTHQVSWFVCLFVLIAVVYWCLFVCLFVCL